MNKPILVECPRDAMQGLKPFIPTDQKARYLNQLLKVGFDVLDFGSFVSPKAIPQLRDTAEVLNKLNLSSTQTKLLAIIANKRGAEDAVSFDEIQYLGYPFSISETFQQRNTKATIEESLIRVEEIQNVCEKKGKKMVVYISMGFGNPYGDPYSPEIAIQWSEKLVTQLGIEIISLADTIGVSNPENIKGLFSALIPALPSVTFGAHLHTTPETWREKVSAAWEAGCYRFDGALKGFGGCPMAEDELVGNMPMEKIVQFFEEQGVETALNKVALEKSMELAGATLG